MVKKPASLQPQDKYVVRLPDGMRDRIKVEADRNNRSMNAEIVATLEEKYPPPTPLFHYNARLDLNIGVLHWNEGAGAWEPVDLDIWLLFRNTNNYPPGRDGRFEGKQYFAFMIFENDGSLINIIPHMYKLNARGDVSGYVTDILTPEQRKEYNRIFLLPHTNPSEDEFVRDAQAQMTPHLYPHADAVRALEETINRFAKPVPPAVFRRKLGLEKESDLTPERFE